MTSIPEKGKRERLSFFVNAELSDRINNLARHTKLPVSEIARKALKNYIDRIEKEKMEAELAAGYIANYEYYQKTQEEWKHADKE